MNALDNRLTKHIDQLLIRYPQLCSIKDSIIDAYLLLERCYAAGGKLLIAGNGGSAADAEHIAGELMKRFRLPRVIDPEFSVRLKAIDPELGGAMSAKLEAALPAVALVSASALSTAYCNDVDAYGLFAQQVYGLGKPGDVFLGISTSGNSVNILNASVVAKAIGMDVIGLTGMQHSELENFANITVKAPETETYMIQELHLPIYHCWCLMLEEHFFAK